MTRVSLRTIVIAALLLGVIAFAPSVSHAHNPNIWPTGYWGPLLSCTGDGGGGLPECKNLCDLAHTIQHFIYFGISIAFFAFAPVFLAWGGIMIIFAGASPGRVETGKKIIWGTVIGIAITLGAFLILDWFLLAVTGSSLSGGIVCTGDGIPQFRD